MGVETTDADGLPTDGERYLPGMGGRIAAEHLARYAFAERFAAGKTVLDVASGEGYGAAIMAERARSVVGVDLAEAAVRFAQKKYSGIGNLEFHVGDVTALSFPDESFEVATCYETVEHIDEPLKAIAELRRVLKDDGVLLVSTPNKQTYSDRFDHHNPFHKKELTFGEFKSALQGSFRHVKCLGQFSSAASCILDVQDDGRRLVPDRAMAVTHANVPKWTGSRTESLADSLYFIAICSNQPLHDAIEPLEFFDAADWRSIEDEFQLQALKGVLGRRDAEIRMLRLAFNSLRDQHIRINREIEAKTAELDAVLNSTTWRAGSAIRNILGRIGPLRKVARALYLAVATKR